MAREQFLHGQTGELLLTLDEAARRFATGGVYVTVGKVTGDELIVGLLLEVGWVVAFALLARTFYRLGLKRYSAFGG